MSLKAAVAKLDAALRSRQLKPRALTPEQKARLAAELRVVNLEMIAKVVEWRDTPPPPGVSSPAPNHLGPWAGMSAEEILVAVEADQARG